MLFGSIYKGDICSFARIKITDADTKEGGFVDWQQLKTEYISGGTSYSKLAKKYDVSLGKIKRTALREHWTELRDQTRTKADLKLVNSVSTKQADKAKKITDVADMLLDKISDALQAMPLVDSQSIKHFSSALKDLKDIKGIKSDADMREQEARIAKLVKDSVVESPDSKVVHVHFVDEMDDYSE